MYRLIIFVFLSLFGCSESLIKIKPNSKPNILLLYIDDLRPELFSYGVSKIQSPNINLLAQKGLQFNNAYCNVPVCGASRASMLTGMLPTKNRFLDYNTFVEKETPNAITIPELFKNNGYTTISNGKVYHHLDDRMNDWDEVWRPYAFDKNDKDLAPTDYWQSLWKDYKNSVNALIYKKTDKGPAYEKPDVSDSTYIDGLMTEKVVRDIKRLKKENKPFFLTAGFINPHLPFNAPKKYWDLYQRHEIEQPKNYNQIPTGAPKISISNSGELRSYNGIPKKGPVSDSLAISLIHGYYATISYTDALIGKILLALKNEGLDMNTIVIFVSDHGYMLQEHTQWAKFTNYNTATQVPLIIYDPRANVKGSTNALVSLIDIYPTLAELCGLKPPENQLDGKSLVSIFKNPESKGKEHVFIKRRNGFTLKTMEYSYTEFINAKSNLTVDKMLYDHRLNKAENINLADSEEFSKIVSDLSSVLHSKFKENVYGK